MYYIYNFFKFKQYVSINLRQCYNDTLSTMGGGYKYLHSGEHVHAFYWVLGFDRIKILCTRTYEKRSIKNKGIRLVFADSFVDSVRFLSCVVRVLGVSRRVYLARILLVGARLPTNNFGFCTCNR